MMFKTSTIRVLGFFWTKCRNLVPKVTKFWGYCILGGRVGASCERAAPWGEYPGIHAGRHHTVLQQQGRRFRSPGEVNCVQIGDILLGDYGKYLRTLDCSVLSALRQLLYTSWRKCFLFLLYHLCQGVCCMCPLSRILLPPLSISVIIHSLSQSNL